MISTKKVILLTMILLFCGLENVSASDWPLEIRFNGQEIKSEVSPVIINGSTLVPVRLLSETMGFNVQWDENTETVNISNANKKIMISLNSNTAYVNEDTVELAVPAQNIDGHVLAPLRFIVESLGLEIVWDAENRIINLYNMSKDQDGKTAEDFLKSLTNPAITSNTCKFICTIDSKCVLNLQGNEEKKQISSTIVNALYKDKQYYSSTAYTSTYGTTTIEMFFDPPQIYLKEKGQAWEQLSLDAFGSTLGGLLNNINSFNNLSIKAMVDLLSPETKIFYGEDQVFDGLSYRTVIIDSKEPGMKKLVEAMVSIENYFPEGVPASLQENCSFVEYDYFNKNTLNIERRKIVSRVDLRDTDDSQNVLTYITEQNFRIFDLGVPITFPDQPLGTQ